MTDRSIRGEECDQFYSEVIVLIIVTNENVLLALKVKRTVCIITSNIELKLDNSVQSIQL